MSESIHLGSHDSISLSSLSSADEAEQLTDPVQPQNMWRRHVFQLSAIQMLVPFGYGIQKREYILAISLALLIAIDVIIHRPGKHAVTDYLVSMHHLLVGVWLTSTAYISLTFTNQKLVLVVSACLSLSALLAMSRKQWPVTSNPRMCMHVAMYFAACLGTMLLLYGSTRNSLSCSLS